MQFKHSILSATIATCLFLFPVASVATTLNFETGYVDNQELLDGVVLLDNTGVATNVVLSTLNSNTMSIEARGNNDGNPDGFVNDPIPRGTERRDVESAIETSSLGNYFLRTTSSLSGNFLTFNPVFTLSFVGGVSQVGAEIWDIDGNTQQGSESWHVLATLAGGGTQSLFSPEYMNTSDAGSLNGQAWDFNFTTAGNDILQLDFIFTGTKTEGIGVAFDNMTVSQVPLPSGLVLLLSGLGLVGLRRRWQSA